MRQISLTINDKALVVEAEPEKPLLWVLREDLGLTGAKYGCGMAVCGCCVVRLNGDAIRSRPTSKRIRARKNGCCMTTMKET
jgi:isoquinoline 1-oxidoreductase subunit alpha